MTDFEKGKPKSGGRRKGIPNKLTADVKAMILAAFKNVGGATYLEKQANSNPVAFMGLLGKILPLQVTGDKDSPVHIVVETGVPRAGES